MKKLLVAAMLCASATGAFGQAEKKDPSSLSSKQMEKQAGEEGMTAKPTAKPENKGSLSDKAMDDHPGTTGGTTDTPTAEPKTGDLPAGAEDDMGKK